MKKITFLLLCMTWFSNAQIVNIPDANFKAALIADGVDTNMDGEIQESEALTEVNLDVSNSNIVDLTGIEAFVNILVLDCAENQLTTIDVTQNVNLESLSCENNQITNLNLTQNTNLDFIACQNNQLTDLDTSQNTNLESLLCGNNQLVNLNVNGNILLETLWCFENQLTELDLTQNPNLVNLICNNNILSAIDTSQNVNLQLFICYSNQLSELDISQNTLLQSLRCFDNQIASLDASANINLITLLCQQNELTELNIKNGSTADLLNFSDNPNLFFICADDEEVTSVQAEAEPTTVVSSYCSFVPGGSYNTITGSIIYDLLEDGCDAIDVPQPHIKINLADGSPEGEGSTFTNNNGNYTFYTGIGNFDVIPDVEDPSWFDITPNSATILFADTNNNIEIQDFCIIPVGEHNDVEIYVAPIDFARPGFDAVYQVVYRNKGNQIASGNIEFTYQEDELDFISATQAPDSQSDGNLTWNYSNLLPFENRSVYITLNVNSPVENPAVNIDDILDFSTSINATPEDENLSNNIFYYKQTVVGSYDPNDITCLQGDVVPTNLIGEYLSYIVNFENIGTFEAENVVIEIDVDPAQFDINSLRVMNASHMVDTRVNDDKVKFIFENINLAASGGHGNILIRIQSNNTLQSGEFVTKRANIHFDYNFPVETNDANTVFENLSLNDVEQDMSVQIYPNPAHDELHISAQRNIKTVEVFDVQGRVIQTLLVDNSNVLLNISKFTNGIYFFRIKTELGEHVQKIIKE